MSDKKAYLSPKEAAAYLNKGLSTLARYRVEGVGPVYARLGRNILYRKCDLDAWIVERLRYSTVSRACPYTGKLPEIDRV